MSSTNPIFATATTDVKHVRRSHNYYITGGDLFLLVNGQWMFRIHSHFFTRESQLFRSWLDTAAVPGQAANGGSEGTALILDDVQEDDLALFLWVFYNPSYSLYEADINDWDRILDLATRWDFPKVRELALRELQTKEMPAIKRLVLYHKYDFEQYVLEPFYAEVASREELPAQDDFEELGLPATYAIFKIRELLRASSPDGKSPLPSAVSETDVTAVVRRVLKETMGKASQSSSTRQPSSTPTPGASKTPNGNSVKASPSKGKSPVNGRNTAKS